MNDDYNKWYSNWVGGWKEDAFKKKVNKDYSNNIYSFEPKNPKNTKFKKDFYSEHFQVQFDVSVSNSFMERLETSLAKVNLALDNLLNYLHDKKSI